MTEDNLIRSLDALLGLNEDEHEEVRSLVCAYGEAQYIKGYDTGWSERTESPDYHERFPRP